MEYLYQDLSSYYSYLKEANMWPISYNSIIQNRLNLLQNRIQTSQHCPSRIIQVNNGINNPPLLYIYAPESIKNNQATSNIMQNQTISNDPIITKFYFQMPYNNFNHDPNINLSYYPQKQVLVDPNNFQCIRNAESMPQYSSNQTMEFDRSTVLQNILDNLEKKEINKKVKNKIKKVKKETLKSNVKSKDKKVLKQSKKIETHFKLINGIKMLEKCNVSTNESSTPSVLSTPSFQNSISPPESMISRRSVNSFFDSLTDVTYENYSKDNKTFESFYEEDEEVWNVASTSKLPLKKRSMRNNHSNMSRIPGNKVEDVIKDTLLTKINKCKNNNDICSQTSIHSLQGKSVKKDNTEESLKNETSFTDYTFKDTFQTIPKIFLPMEKSTFSEDPQDDNDDIIFIGFNLPNKKDDLYFTSSI